MGIYFDTCCYNRPYGDYTKEKYEYPDLTPDEFAAMAEEAKAEAEAVGVWE